MPARLALVMASCICHALAGHVGYPATDLPGAAIHGLANQLANEPRTACLRAAEDAFANKCAFSLAQLCHLSSSDFVSHLDQ